MPALITHFLFGNCVLEEIKEDFAKTNDEYDAFRFGLQGPDIFFFVLKRLQGEYKLNKFGVDMHNKYISEPIDAMANFANSCEGNKYCIVKNYIGGYLCHYALDRKLHPYVNFSVDIMCGEDHCIDRQRYYHRKIETALDVIFLRYSTGKTVYDYGIKEIIRKNDEVEHVISEMYRHVFLQVFNFDISERVIKKTFSYFRFVQSFLFSPSGVKRGIIKALESAYGLKYRLISVLSHPLMEDDDYDYSNSQKEIWIDYNDNTESQCSVFELIDSAKIDASKMLFKLPKLIKREINGNDISQGINFSGRTI